MIYVAAEQENADEEFLLIYITCFINRSYLGFCLYIFVKIRISFYFFTRKFGMFLLTFVILRV